jgi:hypothetical protein
MSDDASESELDQEVTKSRAAVRDYMMRQGRRTRRKRINEDKTENAAGVTPDGIGSAREAG